MIKKIEVWFKNTSEPRIYENVINTFEEGSMFCIDTENKIYKYPIEDLFRIVHYKSL